ncbi:hypothetical protein [Kitasatospora paranensis]|uniref:hypothetical protein n=1 Tax=Kitasatospora paranensis TaxID=258053 RepID=UPI0031EEB4C8
MSDVTAVDRAQTRDGGTVRWAVDAVPATLNVYQPEATADSELIARALLPGLFRLDDRGRAVPDPDYLAGAVSTAAGHSPQTVTYRLNPAAVWSDGSPLSAADFTAQWKALSGADPAFRSTRPAGYDAIASVSQEAARTRSRWSSSSRSPTGGRCSPRSTRPPGRPPRTPSTSRWTAPSTPRPGRSP